MLDSGNDIQASDRGLHLIVDNVGALIAYVDRDQCYRFVNQRYEEFFGIPRDRVIGRQVASVIPPDSYEQVRENIDSVLDGAHVTFELELKSAAGELRLMAVTYVPDVGEVGDVQGFFVVVKDASRFNTLLARERERVETLERKTQLLAAVTEAIAIYLDRGDWQTSNAILLRAAVSQTQSEYGFLGVVVGDSLRVLAHEGLVWNDQVNREFYDNAIDSYNELGYLEFNSFQNLFGAVITGGDVVVTNDAPSDSRSAGLPAGHPPLDRFLGVPIRKGDEVVGLIGLANREGGYTGRERADIETLVRHAGVLCDSYRRQLREDSLESERQRGRKRQKLLARELDHRVKNNLAAVVSLAQLTGNSVETKAEFLEVFTRRVAAMARAHESLADERWLGANLLDLARLALSPYAGKRDDRIRLRGSDMTVTARIAQPLALTLHELATNAVTHGALSSADGVVEVELDQSKFDHIELTWRERNGPPVTPPAKFGLGLSLVTGLVERELAGRLKLDFAATGLTCSILVPLRRD